MSFATPAIKAASNATAGSSAYRAAQARLEALKLREMNQDKLDHAQRIQQAKLPPPPPPPPLLLPTTRNLYELNQWRKKHNLPLDGSRDPKQVATRSLPSPKPGPSQSPNKPTSTQKKSKPVKALPALPPTREEKAAARRAALFDDDKPARGRGRYSDDDDDDDNSSTGMLLAKMGRTLQGESRIGQGRQAEQKLLGRPTSAREVESVRKSLSLGSTKIVKKSSKNSNSSNAIASGSGQSNASGSEAGAMGVKERLKAAFNQKDLQKLNLHKNDNRTIEEVERDMKLRRTGSAHSASPAPAASSNGTKRSASTGTLSNSMAEKKRPRINSAINSGPSTSFYAVTNSSTSSTAGSNSKLGSTSKSAAYTEAHSLPPRPIRPSNNTNKLDLSREIQEIMRPGRPSLAANNAGTRTYFKGDRGRWDDEDSDSGSDMEGTHDDVMREEEYARRIAEEEDAREDARLRAAAERKRSRQ